MRSPTARPDLRSFGGWSKSRIRDSLGAPGHSAEFLGESDEDPFRPADVAEPIRVFIPDYLANELRSALAKPLERLIDVVNGEHHAQVA